MQRCRGALILGDLLSGADERKAAKLNQECAKKPGSPVMVEVKLPGCDYATKVDVGSLHCDMDDARDLD